MRMLLVGRFHLMSSHWVVEWSVQLTVVGVHMDCQAVRWEDIRSAWAWERPWRSRTVTDIACRYRSCSVWVGSFVGVAGEVLGIEDRPGEEKRYGLNRFRS
jgi:hypothetical protein